MEGRGPPSIPPWPAVRACPKDPDGTVWGVLRPPPQGPPPDPAPTPAPRPASLTQLPKELYPQGGIDEEEQHEKEAQVAHLWRQQVGLGRAGGGLGQGRPQAPGEGPA